MTCAMMLVYFDGNPANIEDKMIGGKDGKRPTPIKGVKVSAIDVTRYNRSAYRDTGRIYPLESSEVFIVPHHLSPPPSAGIYVLEIAGKVGNFDALDFYDYPITNGRLTSYTPELKALFEPFYQKLALAFEPPATEFQTSGIRQVSPPLASSASSAAVKT